MPNRNLVFGVDDDPGMLNGVRRLLREHDYDSVLFSSAEAFRNHDDFDAACCLILDIDLKRESGIDLRRRLKAAGISLPVIYITANDSPAVRLAGLVASADQALVPDRLATQLPGVGIDQQLLRVAA